MDLGLLILKALASIFSLGMILSPSLELYRTHKRKHTGEMALLPLIGLWVNSHMWYVLCTDYMSYALVSDMCALCLFDACPIGWCTVWSRAISSRCL